MGSPVDYDALDAALKRCGSSWDAAQTHGLLSGRLAIAGADSGFEWLEQVLEDTDPNNVLVAVNGGQMEEQPVPAEFLVIDGSPRDPQQGKPSDVFRYDLVYELVSAVVEDRDALPGFDHGAAAQAVADAVLDSFDRRTWIDIESDLG